MANRRPDRIADALNGLLGGGRRGRVTRPVPDARDLAGRLAVLERDVQEVRTRVNALFFTVLAALLGDLAGRLVLG